MNPVTSCPICFEILSDKIKASPDNCEHIFCLPCLEKWSKLGSYCPVDRKRFKKILNLSTDAVIQVKSHKRKRRRTVYDFTAHCEICSSTTDSNVMLLCDCCDLGYHIHCLNPPLKEIPAGLWFCPTCISVEEKLKKKNGITKEVEAELGGFNDKLLYKTKCREKVINEKKSMVKAKKLDNSVPVKNDDNFQTCYDIISNFEDMIVRKKHCVDAGSSNYLDSTINKIDKIYKSFDIASKNSRVGHSNYLKTYSVRKACMKAKRIKSYDVEQGKKSYSETDSINTDDTCLNQNSISSDINLQNHTLSVPHEFLNVDTLYDDVDDDHSLNRKDIEQLNANSDNIQVEIYSEASGILSDEFFEDSPQRKNRNVNSSTVPIFEDMNSFGSENMTVLDKNPEVTATKKSPENIPAIDKVVELTAERKSFENMPVLERNVKLSATRKSFEKVPLLEKNLRGEAEKSLAIKQKKFTRTVIASNAEDSIPSSSCVRDKSSKEKCVSSRGNNFDSANFQPRVVLSRINLNYNNLNCVPKSPCTLTSSESCSYYNFQASASDKLIKTNENFMSVKVSNPSKKCLPVSTHGGRKDSSSDNESENSDISGHTEIYNSSFQHFSDIHNESLFASDVGDSTSFNENKDNSVDINDEKLFSSDTDEESECNNKNSASFTKTVKNFTGDHNKNSFSSDEEEESDCNNYENSTSFNENIESSVDVQKETSPNPRKPLSRNSLRHLAIGSDGSFYLNSSLFKNCAIETESKAKGKPSSSYVEENYNKEVTQVHINYNGVRETSEPLSRTKIRTSEFHTLSKNNESKLCEESMPDDERLMESFESAYDDTYFHDSESSSDDERTELNAEPLTENAKSAPLSLNDLKYIAINPDGTFSISRPPLKANETDSQSRNATLSAQPLSEHNQGTVNCDSQLSNQSVNLDILNENENFTEEETFSEGDSVSGNHISQLTNESSVSSTHLSQNEQSQFNNESVTTDLVNENETLAYESEPFSERDSSSGNHISQLTNESSVSSTHLSQNEQSQLNNVSVTSDPIHQTETRTYEPDPFSDDDIEIVTIYDKSATNFRDPSQNEQRTTYQPTSESISAVNADNVQQPDNNNQNEKMIHWQDSQYIIPKEDGLYFFEQ